ncbi:MAG: dTMP kinase [Cucumibacter sp.]
MTARFITFEGGEGVGKSTQIKRLMANLNRAGVPVVRTREPGGTPKAEAIRSFILQGRCQDWGPGAEAVLFAAARLDHVKALIAPSLEAGKWVLSDRFADSTRAYQGLTGGVPDLLIDGLEVLALDGRAPDLTFVMDMDPTDAFERVARKAEEEGVPVIKDRFEKETLDWHRKLREGYLEIARRNQGRCIVIDAGGNEDEIEAKIWATLSERFAELKAAG